MNKNKIKSSISNLMTVSIILNSIPVYALNNIDETYTKYNNDTEVLKDLSNELNKSNTNIYEYEKSNSNSDLVNSPSISYYKGNVVIRDTGNSLTNNILEDFNDSSNLKFEFSNPKWNIEGGVLSSEIFEGHDYQVTENQFTINANKDDLLRISVKPYLGYARYSWCYIYVNGVEKYRGINADCFKTIDILLDEGVNTIKFECVNGDMLDKDDRFLIDSIEYIPTEKTKTYIKYRIDGGEWIDYYKPFQLDGNWGDNTTVEAKTIIDGYESPITTSSLTIEQDPVLNDSSLDVTLTEPNNYLSNNTPVDVKVSGKFEIYKQKWIFGRFDEHNFPSSGYTNFTGYRFTVPQDGWYTVLIEDSLGNIKTSQINVTKSTFVNIPDVCLRTEINRMLGISADTLPTKAQLKKITSLSMNGEYISDLEGIQYCINLNSLYIDNNKLTDISLISGLSNLKRLSFMNNEIVDISSISKLSNLTYLSLTNNKISDISAISGLINLSSLDLTNNQISDISPLKNLNPSIFNYLYIGGNKISDLSPLSGLINIEELCLGDNNISDIAPLMPLEKLYGLELFNNNISDVSPVVNLKNLEWLYLSNNPLKDISPLGLTNLPCLELDNTEISDITALSNLKDLFYISLNDNYIKDLTPLSNLEYLSTLNLRNNQISDISALSTIGEIGNLDLRNNKISDISPIAKILNISDVYLDDNYITDIDSLLNSKCAYYYIYLYNNYIDLSDDSENTKIVEELDKKNITAHIEGYITGYSSSHPYPKDYYHPQKMVSINEKYIELNCSDLYSPSLILGKTVNGIEFEKDSELALDLTDLVYTIEDNKILEVNNSNQIIAKKPGETMVNISYKGIKGKGSVDVKIKVIDTDNPKLNYEILPDCWTNKTTDIKISATDNTGIKKILLPDGTETSEDSIVYSVSENGVYKFTAIDIFDNLGTLDVTVSNIDKVKPNIKYTIVEKNDNYIIVDFEVSDDLSGVKSLDCENKTINKINDYRYKITENDVYTFTIYDNAGNSNTLTINIDSINKSEIKEPTLNDNNDSINNESSNLDKPLTGDNFIVFFAISIISILELFIINNKKNQN